MKQHEARYELIRDDQGIKIRDRLRDREITNPRSLLDWNAGEYRQETANYLASAHFIGEVGFSKSLEILDHWYRFTGKDKDYDAEKRLAHTIEMLSSTITCVLDAKNCLAVIQQHYPDGLSSQLQDALTKFAKAIEPKYGKRAEEIRRYLLALKL